MARVPFRAAAVTRLIKSAENAGWPRGSFKVVVDGARVELVPIGGEIDDAADIARRIDSLHAGPVQ